jgi:UDP-glucose 4-epimerase
MKILVTGGAGYIGSHTVVELILDGHDVVILDDLSNSKASVIDRIGLITGAAPELIVGDIRDRTMLDRVLEGAGFDAVMHFAALKAVGESVKEPLKYWDVNVTGSLRLIEAMVDHGLDRIVFSSSATVYGEPDAVPVSEASPVRPPSNPYGWTKLVIEQMLTDTTVAHPSWGVALLRYFNPIGAHASGLIGEDPNDEPNNLMPYIAQVASERLPELKVFGDDYPTRDGTGIRDYLHVVDLAKGHTAALNKLMDEPRRWVYNLGTGRGTSVLELVAAFEEASGVSVPYRVVERRPGDIAELWADPSLAERELGWKATRGVEQMCVDTWRWQQFVEGRTD